MYRWQRDCWSEFQIDSCRWLKNIRSLVGEIEEIKDSWTEPFVEAKQIASAHKMETKFKEIRIRKKKLFSMKKQEMKLGRLICQKCISKLKCSILLWSCFYRNDKICMKEWLRYQDCSLHYEIQKLTLMHFL